VVGGGFTGAVLAARLLRGARRPTSVVLVEPRAEAGRGVAYSTPSASHLLNVRAGGMSAFPEAPGDFADWLSERGAGGPDDFVPRGLYGAYVADRLASAEALSPHAALERAAARALSADEDADGVRIALDDGRTVRADAAALCVGLPPSRAGARLGLADDAPGWAASPWAPGALDGLAPDDAVLLVGTGLTMVDAALSLDDAGTRAPVLAVSRRGLLPRPHAPAPLPPLPPPATEADARAGLARLLRVVRAAAQAAEASGGDWRQAVDGLRPAARGLWAALGPDARARFLRHLRPWWDVYRHRASPAAAARIDGLLASGRLRVVAGSVLSAVPAGDGVAVALRLRGADAPETVRVRRVVDCTGPAVGADALAEGIVGALVASGAARPDPLGLGLETDAAGALVDAAGRASARILVVGPLRRGATWENTAVPELRAEAALAADRLLAL
jgi:uncharacterized NAD(P)/FAD-binding protein YdhS